MPIDSSARVFDPDRLLTVESYGVLDTPREPVFDAIVAEAATGLQAPMAFMTILDGRRQWIKASVGSPLVETTLDQAICVSAIEPGGVFVVRDCSQDPRVNWCPAVYGTPPILFYAGAPLMSREGHPLGTLCVVDSQPRPAGIDEAQAHTLERLAGRAMGILEARRSARRSG